MPIMSGYVTSNSLQTLNTVTYTALRGRASYQHVQYSEIDDAVKATLRMGLNFSSACIQMMRSLEFLEPF